MKYSTVAKSEVDNIIFLDKSNKVMINFSEVNGER